MGDFKCVCFFQQYSKKECNLSARNKSARSILIVKNCSSSTKDHLYGCFKTSRERVEEDGKLCLAELNGSTSAEKISPFVPSTGMNLAWDGGQVKFVNIMRIRANSNRTEGYPWRCREKFTYGIYPCIMLTFFPLKRLRKLRCVSYTESFVLDLCPSLACKQIHEICPYKFICF